MILYRSSVADFFVLKPCIRICSLEINHFFTLIATDVYNFLGATLRDATSQCVRHHNKQTFRELLTTLKAYFVNLNEDFCQFKFNFVHKVCVFSFFFTYFTYFEQCSNLVIGKLTPRSIRNRFRLIC